MRRRYHIILRESVLLSVCDGLLSVSLPGHKAYARLRPLAYPDCDVVLVCFDLSKPGGIKEVKRKVRPSFDPHEQV